LRESGPWAAKRQSFLRSFAVAQTAKAEAPLRTLRVEKAGIQAPVEFLGARDRKSSVEKRGLGQTIPASLRCENTLWAV
jgi:hypothetical protein